MKRSKMIKIIAEEVRGITEIAFLSSLDIAERILETVENAGMKPPLKERCPVLLTDKHVWEKEDGK